MAEVYGIFSNPQLILNQFGYTNGAGGWQVEKHLRFLADMTGNGKADIIGFGNDGVYVALNNGDGTFQPSKLVLHEFDYEAGGWRVEMHPRFLADLTGNGCADIISFGYSGFYVALNNGDGTFKSSVFYNEFGYYDNAGGWRVEKHPRFLADLTGDGKADIIGFADNGVYVALNNGDGTFQPSKLVLHEFGYEAGGWRVEKHLRFLADLTGDGKADIIGFGNDGVYVALNNGDGTFQPSKLVLHEFDYEAGGWRVEMHPRFLADLTGNGCADIISFGYSGFYVALNNGDGTFKSSVFYNEFGYYDNAGGWRVEKHPRFLADLTGDGKADIIGFADNGVYVALNNGDGTFQPSKLVLHEFGYEAGGWRVEKHLRFLADLTGDGKADIIGFGNDGVSVSNNCFKTVWKPEELQEFVEISMKSRQGDYLIRPDQPSGVTTGDKGTGSEWIVETAADGKIMLKSWKGDYLIRPDQPSGVTTGDKGTGSEWIVEIITDGKFMLKSWKGDYLIRPDQPSGVTTWSTGIDNEWTIELNLEEEDELERMNADEVDEEKFASIKNSLTQDPGAMQAFLTNPAPTLAQAGIPCVEKFSYAKRYQSTQALATRSTGASDSTGANEGESLKVKWHWWGIDFVMNEKLTQDIIDGTTTTETLTGILAEALVAARVITGPVGTVIGGAIAAVMKLKALIIKIANNGNGVHWPITWLQWAALILPPTPDQVFLKASLIVIPFRN